MAEPKLQIDQRLDRLEKALLSLAAGIGGMSFTKVEDILKDKEDKNAEV